MNERPTFECSAEVAELVKLFTSRNEGDTIEHGELAKTAGRYHQPLMPSVRKSLISEGIVIGSVRGIGYKILSGVETLDKGHDYRRRIRKANAKRVNELRTIDPQKLPDETEQGRYHQEVAHTAMMHHIHAKECQTRLSSASSVIKPSPGQTLTLSQLRNIFAPAL